MKTVGIIGFGSFGKFLAEKLDSFVEVRVFSASGKPNKWASSLEQVTATDFLILSIPLEAYKDTLNKIKKHLGTKTVIVDVCSVKQDPLQIIRSILPKQPTVSTHPLFGPESAGDSLIGHTLVLCPEDSDKQALETIESFALQIELKVINMSAEEHDEEMAVVQGLTFFVAHSLKDMNLHQQKLSTPSFEKLLQLASLEKHHSDELFNTIQTGNTKTKDIRQRFIKLAKSLDQKITHHQK